MKLFNLYKDKITNKYTLYTTKTLWNWFNIYITDPLGTWKQVKEYFIKPKISFKIHKVTKISGYPYAWYGYLGKILDIHISDVDWKDKYDSPRHERNPIVYICLFRLIAFVINFNVYYKDEFGKQQDGNPYYWEYVLEYLHYKNKKTLKCYSVWRGQSELYKEIIYGDKEDGSDDTFKPLPYIIPTVSMSLNKKGIEKLKQEL